MNEVRRTKLHSRQHFTLHIRKCQLFSPSRDTIYRHQKYGRCALQHTYIYEVDKDTCTDFCEVIGWTNLPRFGKCVPTKLGSKAANTRTTTITTPELPVGYKIPKKKKVSATRPSLEDGEVVVLDKDDNQHAVACGIVRTKKARTEDSSTKLFKAIKLLKSTEHMEKQAKRMREEANHIRQRYDNCEPHSK